MTHVYTRERHENKNMRFWATYATTWNSKVLKPELTYYRGNF